MNCEREWDQCYHSLLDLLLFQPCRPGRDCCSVQSSDRGVYASDFCEVITTAAAAASARDCVILRLLIEGSIHSTTAAAAWLVGEDLLDLAEDISDILLHTLPVGLSEPNEQCLDVCDVLSTNQQLLNVLMHLIICLGGGKGKHEDRRDNSSACHFSLYLTSLRLLYSALRVK